MSLHEFARPDVLSHTANNEYVNQYGLWIKNGLS
jgi:hypothetical protein